MRPPLLPRPLSHSEREILAALTRAAEQGTACPMNAELDARIGANSASTSATIVKRLEGWGLIRVERWQRERRVTIVATGKATAEVRTRAPHWRDRPRNIPAPTPQRVKLRDPERFDAILAAARREERELAEFLADLVWLGWGTYREVCGA